MFNHCKKSKKHANVQAILPRTEIWKEFPTDEKVEDIKQ